MKSKKTRSSSYLFWNNIANQRNREVRFLLLANIAIVFLAENCLYSMPKTNPGVIGSTVTDHSMICCNMQKGARHHEILLFVHVLHMTDIAHGYCHFPILNSINLAKQRDSYNDILMVYPILPSFLTLHRITFLSQGTQTLYANCFMLFVKSINSKYILTMKRSQFTVYMSSCRGSTQYRLLPFV